MAFATKVYEEASKNQSANTTESTDEETTKSKKDNVVDAEYEEK